MRTARHFSVVTAALATLGCEAATRPTLSSDDASASVAFNSSGNGVVASATGSAHRIRADELWVLAFNAVKRADGTTTGEARIDRKDLGISWNLDVTCLSVQGNTAWIAGIIRNARGPVIREGTVSYFYVVDNGEGDGDPPDVASAVRINDVAGQDQEFCNLRPLALPATPVERGNVQVRAD
ncbi:MAG: hypothetical protein ABR499_15290 [Gemmatimonadaceae bacterium]